MNDQELSLAPITSIKKTSEMEAHSNEAFSYDGYQVVRGEFFAHLFEPSVTLKKEKVFVNTACIRKLPDIDYVQFLVNPVEKKLAVKPCSEDTKDSFRWASGTGKGRKPKMISCKIFYAKVMELVGWDFDARHKILGKLIRTKTDMVFVFDLNSSETFASRSKRDEVSIRKPFFPEEWKHQFGLTVKEHQDKAQIDIFDDYAVFRIDRVEEENARREVAINDTNAGSNSNNRHEEATHTNPQDDASYTE